MDSANTTRMALSDDGCNHLKANRSIFKGYSSAMPRESSVSPPSNASPGGPPSPSSWQHLLVKQWDSLSRQDIGALVAQQVVHLGHQARGKRELSDVSGSDDAADSDAFDRLFAPSAAGVRPRAVISTSSPEITPEGPCLKTQQQQQQQPDRSVSRQKAPFCSSLRDGAGIATSWASLGRDGVVPLDDRAENRGVSDVAEARGAQIPRVQTKIANATKIGNPGEVDCAAARPCVVSPTDQSPTEQFPCYAGTKRQQPTSCGNDQPSSKPFRREAKEGCEKSSRPAKRVRFEANLSSGREMRRARAAARRHQLMELPVQVLRAQLEHQATLERQVLQLQVELERQRREQHRVNAGLLQCIRQLYNGSADAPRRDGRRA